jgi:hypothetical protein
MATSDEPRRFPRRFLLKLGAGTATAAVAGLGRVRAAVASLGFSTSPSLRPVYYLDPEWGAGDVGCPATPDEAHRASHACHACRACHAHAAHKLWASATCVRRAHVGCNCEVRERLIPLDHYRRLFAATTRRRARCEVDDRW